MTSAHPHDFDSRATRPKDLVQSLERGITILTAFDDEHPVMNLTDIARRCGIPRSATRRFLHTLADLGYVSVSGRHFELTPQVLELGYSYLSRLTLADIVRPHAEELARELGASISVAVLDGPDVRYICRVNAPSALAVSIRVGSRIAAEQTGLGRVLLASLTPQQLEEHWAHFSNSADAPSAKDREDLQRALETIRKQNWSYEDQLLEVGVRAVAVPLHNRDGDVVAALSASLQEAGMPSRTMISTFVPRLVEKAAQISLELRRGIEA